MSAEFDVRVVPRSSQEKVLLAPDGSVKVWVRASPVEGQGNDSVCALLAKALGVSKSNVQVTRGQAGRSKRIRIEGIEPSELQKRLSSKG